ncbi:hypothetical protein Tco_1486677 [Tanacetum coccineum]
MLIGGLGSEHDVSHSSKRAVIFVEEKAKLQCPPRWRRYETLAFSRLDMFEVERLSLTQKYKEQCCRFRVACEKLKKVLSANPRAPMMLAYFKESRKVKEIYAKCEYKNLPSAPAPARLMNKVAAL